MSTFKRILTEKKRRDYGRKGGQGSTPYGRMESSANVQDPARSGKGAFNRNNPLTADEILRRGRPKGSAAAQFPGAPEAGTWFGSDKEAIRRGIELDTQSREDRRSGRVGRQATHPEDAKQARSSGKSRTGGKVFDEPLVGKQKSRSRFVKGQGFTIPTRGRSAERIPGGTGKYTGSLSKGTLEFSGDAKYKRMLRRLATDVKPLPPGTGVRKSKGVSQAEVSTKQQEFRTKQQKLPVKPKVTKSVIRSTDRISGISPSPTSRPALTSSQQKRVTQKILQSAQPQFGRRLAPKTVPNLAAKVNAQAATKTAAKTTLRGTIGRGLAGAAGAAFDVIQGREDAKKAGASDKRAWLRGISRAVGGALGATAGGLAGGGFGSFALGTAGYMAGSQAGDKLFTSLAGATQKQKDWLKQRNLATQAGTKSADVQYRKGNQAVVFDKRVGKERIGTWDPTSQTYKAGMTNPTKAYTAKNPFERLGRQFARSNEGSGLFGMNLVKGYGLADMAKRYYAGKDEAARKQRVSDFKRTANR